MSIEGKRAGREEEAPKPLSKTRREALHVLRNPLTENPNLETPN